MQTKAMTGALLLGFLLTRPAESSPGDPDLRPLVPQQIAPKIHVLATAREFYGPAIGNITLIEQSDGFVIIDSGITAVNGRAVVAYCRSLSAKPIKVVAITHWHNDHPQGVSAIRDAYPAVRIIATRATEAGMLGPEAFDVGYAPDPRADAAVAHRIEGNKNDLRKMLEDSKTDVARQGRINNALTQLDDYVRDFAGTYIVPPTETFDHKMVLADRDAPVTLMYLGRANTAGDLVAWLPRQKIIASGDIVVSPIPFGFGSYPESWIRTIQRIKSLRFKVLIPGHGDPQFDASYLDKLIRVIGNMRTGVVRLSGTGASLAEVSKQMDLSTLASEFGASEQEHAAFRTLFGEPMIENIYKETHKIPIVQGQGMPVPEFTQSPPQSRSIHHPY